MFDVCIEAWEVIDFMCYIIINAYSLFNSSRVYPLFSLKRDFIRLLMEKPNAEIITGEIIILMISMYKSDVISTVKSSILL